MPRPGTPPPIVWIERTPKGRMVAIFADGRVAGREQGEGNTWEPIDHIDYHALWPAPAPEAPIADQPEVRFGALDWQPGLWRCGCGFLLATTKKSCTTCGEVSPALRPEPTP